MRSQSKGMMMLLVLFFGFVSGAIGGGITGYVAAGTHTTTQTTSESSRTVVEESNTATVVRNTKHSVVSIVISKKQAAQPEQVNPFAGNPFFDDPFGQQQTPDTNTGVEADTTVQVCSGTGFVITADGMILTNRHVICEDNAIYTVEFDDGTTYDATVLARDPLTDLAILKIEAENLTPLTLGDSSSATEGQTVIAIGNTLGEYANTVTKGIVSGLSRDIGGNYTGLIQTDAAINEGNSGGPLLNLEGEVIGINTAIDRSGEGIGFAIPINDAKAAIASTEQYGRIIRAALGVRYIPVDAAVAKTYTLPYEYGAYIEPQEQGGADGVIDGSAADKAGITEGDIILQVDGVQVDADHPLAGMIKSRVVGDTVTLRVYHDGAEKDVDVTLEELPESATTTE
jgi:serine protease Do